MHKRNKKITKKSSKQRQKSSLARRSILKRLGRHRALFLALLGLLLLITAGIVILVVTVANKDKKLEVSRGHQSSKAVMPLNPDSYKSLNLAEARQATYSNSSITQVKSFGLTNGTLEQLVAFKVPKDSLNEYALMTLPAGASNSKTKYPVIILCHGYANPEAYSTLENYVGDMEYYSRHGFAVIKPDFRGNGFSIAAGTPDGAFYSMGYNTDVMSLIAAIKKTSYLDSKNISIWGHSMGAYVALRAAVVSPDIKHVVLLSGPVGTAQDMYLDYEPISDYNNSVALDIRNEQITQHGTPVSNPNYWDKASPLNYLKQMKADVQIHVGSDDLIVPPKFSADLNARLTADNIPHEYYIYPGGTHGLGQQRGILWPRTLKFLTAKKPSATGTRQGHS